MTVSEIKEIKVSGYKTDMDKITVKVPMQLCRRAAPPLP